MIITMGEHMIAIMCLFILAEVDRNLLMRVIWMVASIGSLLGFLWRLWA